MISKSLLLANITRLKDEVQMIIPEYYINNIEGHHKKVFIKAITQQFIRI